MKKIIYMNEINPLVAELENELKDQKMDAEIELDGLLEQLENEPEDLEEDSPARIEAMATEDLIDELDKAIEDLEILLDNLNYHNEK